MNERWPNAGALIQWSADIPVRSNRRIVPGLGISISALQTRLMPPIWKHKAKQIATPVAEHALYGLATTAGLRLLQKAI